MGFLKSNTGFNYYYSDKALEQPCARTTLHIPFHFRRIINASLVPIRLAAQYDLEPLKNTFDKIAFDRLKVCALPAYLLCLCVTQKQREGDKELLRNADWNFFWGGGGRGALTLGETEFTVHFSGADNIVPPCQSYNLNKNAGPIKLHRRARIHSADSE